VAVRKYTFTQNMCDRMIELGTQGASQKMIWADLGITKDVAANWRKKYPEFADALDMALVHSQAYWEREMLANVGNKAFNSRIAEIALRGQFPQDYKDVREIKADIKQEVKIDFAGEVNDLIKQLRANAT
jgi:hypothetical protein